MIRFAAALVFIVANLVLSDAAVAHCDTTSGPVVTAARAALAAGDARLVLHWVRPQDEAEVSEAFRRAMEVRALGPAARTFADRAFFETLVRVHRAGEGAAYTGLSEGAPEPIIAATDRALARGSASEVEGELIAAVRAGLADRFAAARAARDFRPGDVAAGRAFVAAYVPLTHWVEAVFAVAKSGESAHHGSTAVGSAAAHPPGHDGEGHGTPTAAAEAHGREATRHLPWILTGVLAIAAVIEGAVLFRRRPRVAS